MAGDGPPRLLFHPGPRAYIGHPRTQHRVGELMPAPHRVVSAEQGSTRERQVAHSVQYLVANEFVRETRTLRVENAVVADYEGIFERRAECVARVPQARHIAQEAEGARARYVAERFGLYVDGQCLTPNQRVLELDLCFDAEPAGVRAQLSVGVPLRDPHRLEPLDVAPRAVERLEPPRIDCRHKGRRTAIHDR